jgi:hypothetical protein
VIRTGYGTLGIALAALLLVAACGSSTADNPSAVAGLIPAEEMKGLNWSGMTEAQKATAVAVLNTEGCPCGLTLARCRRDKPTSRTSLGIASQVLALARQGKTQAQIVAAVQQAARQQGQVRPALQQQQQQGQQEPKKFVEFPIPAGNAPYLGPPDAPVTILHYLDFQ